MIVITVSLSSSQDDRDAVIFLFIMAYKLHSNIRYIPITSRRAKDVRLPFSHSPSKDI